MDLLLQSWGGKIRVFPAVPSAWTEAGFRDLRAMDGFLVSAFREKGLTAWVAITSEAGEPCVLKVPDWSGPLEVRAARIPAITALGPGEYRVDLRKDEHVVLFPAGRVGEPVVRAVSSASGVTNPFGVKRGGELKTQQTWTEPPISTTATQP